MHSLLSGNLMDVCPVGAITTRDYRFKSRPWDNPEAVDTICTLCEKGCNTTAWLKAKPEWAKGAQLIRMTPRFNPEVNGYWMCDIGRFDYHWIEGDDRLQRPLLRTEAGTLEPTDWRNARRRRSRTGSRPPAAPRRCASSSRRTPRSKSCSLIGRLGGAFGVPEEGVAVSWRQRDKPQPPNVEVQDSARSTRRTCTGARDLGLPGQARRRSGEPDLVGVPRAGRGRAGQGALRLRSGPGGLDRRRVVDHRGAPSRASCRT